MFQDTLCVCVLATCFRRFCCVFHTTLSICVLSTCLMRSSHCVSDGPVLCVFRPHCVDVFCRRVSDGPVYVFHTTLCLCVLSTCFRRFCACVLSTCFRRSCLRFCTTLYVCVLSTCFRRSYLCVPVTFFKRSCVCVSDHNACMCSVDVFQTVLPVFQTTLCACVLSTCFRWSCLCV